MENVHVEGDWSRWSNAALTPRHQFEAWNEALRRTHLDWSLQPPRASSYRGELERHAIGSGRIVRCTCEPLEGERTRAEIARSEGAFFGVVLVTSGAETIRASGRELLLERGSFALWDSERDVRFAVHGRSSRGTAERFEKVSLLVPKDRFRRVVASPERYVGHAVEASGGAGALAVEQLLALTRHAGKIAGTAMERVLDGTLELFGAALGELAAPEDATRSRRVDHIREWILQRLDDPDLGPGRIADAHGLSERTLHAWFQAEGLSVSRWVLLQRLERCKRDLARGDGASITEIALRWGFEDVSYFSRAFKRAFGCSPRAARTS